MWYAVAAIILFCIAFGLFPQVRYPVYRNVPASELPLHFIRPWLLPGCNGYSIMIYHRPSDTIIRVLKHLQPNFNPGGTVNVHVERLCIRNPRKGRLDKRPPLWVRLGSRRMAKLGRSSELRAWRDVTTVWVWDLPSLYKGQVLQRVDCGNSVSRVSEAVQTMIEENKPLRETPFFEVWSKGRFGRFTLGVFEDGGDCT